MDRWLGSSEGEEMHWGQVVWGAQLVTLLLSIWLQIVVLLPWAETMLPSLVLCLFLPSFVPRKPAVATQIASSASEEGPGVHMSPW